ncbi:hypothetical protein [Mesorhizobium sp. LNJC384A00]|uniref:hypothetical protein n=1 Tax=unclassified Mesorhizobium TaxID=325217 RepID=UPI00040D4473|nr:hypothetical protein [Mesorhizobium sp. LNJC384A00]
MKPAAATAQVRLAPANEGLWVEQPRFDALGDSGTIEFLRVSQIAGGNPIERFVASLPV